MDLSSLSILGLLLGGWRYSRRGFAAKKPEKNQGDF